MSGRRPPGGGPVALLARVRPAKVAVFIASLYLFVLAITLMKDGARSLAPLVQGRLAIDGAADALGFGWLFAYVVMSGSPVAAAALTFFDAGAIDRLGAFAMITGSRLGASFIVLFIGFLYVLRGRDRVTSLSMGLLSLTVTGTTYAAGFVVGWAILTTGVLDWAQLGSGTLVTSVVDLVVDPVAGLFVAHLPRWSLFAVGIGIILVSFSLFDRCLPTMSVQESRVGQVASLVYRPWVMFVLGAGITLVSMSVSLSLSILVPLSARGLIRRENVIPYIMGANITTFVDTLLAAVLLDNPPVFTVVLVEMSSIALVSIVILVLARRRYEHAVLAFVGRLTERRANLAVFMAAIFIIPLVLLLH
jgi:solute carrier family 34 (sodium-dependent phosphate cotransporter)